MQISGERQDPIPTGYFASRDGTKLHSEWVAARGAPKAAVVIVHGYSEHAGRHRREAERLAAKGYSVLLFDIRGHGLSEGARGHCERFAEYVDDLVAACARARDASGLPLLLLAHGHGALVALRALVDPAVELPGVRAAVVIAPFLAVKRPPPAIHALLGRVMSRFFPTFAQPRRVDPEHLSHDARVAEEWRADPLKHLVATARWLTESRAAQAYVDKHAARLSLPTLWLIAGDDQIADSDVARRVHERAGGDKEVIVFEGLYHELLHEVDASDILATAEQWLARHAKT